MLIVPSDSLLTDAACCMQVAPVSAKAIIVKEEKKGPQKGGKKK